MEKHIATILANKEVRKKERKNSESKKGEKLARFFRKPIDAEETKKLWMAFARKLVIEAAGP